MEPTRDEAGTDRDRLAAVTEKKGGPGVPESGRADEGASPASEEEPLEAACRTGEEPDAAGEDRPRPAGRTGGFSKIAAGWAQALGAVTEEIPIVVIEEDGEEEAPRADDGPAEESEPAEEPEADEEDSRDAGGDALEEGPEEAGGDAVDGSSHALEETGEEPRAIDESEVPRNARASAEEEPRATDAPAEEAAEDARADPDTTEEFPAVVEKASPAEASEAVEGPSDAPEEEPEEADGEGAAEEIPQTSDAPAEDPGAGGVVAEGPSGGLEEAGGASRADEEPAAAPWDADVSDAPAEDPGAGGGDLRGASPAEGASEAEAVQIVPDTTEEFPAVVEKASPPGASKPAEGPSDGREEPAAAPWDADVSDAPAEDPGAGGGDLRGASPAEADEDVAEGPSGGLKGAAGAEGAVGAPDVTTLRAAETPDAAPVDLPAAKTDLPPSYPPPRRARWARARSGSSPRRRRRWIPHRSTILVVVIVIALTALFKTFVIQWFEIPSGSMEDTLDVGDGVAVTMYDAQDLERGDIVVFTDPDHWLDVEDPTGLRGVIRDALVLIHLLPENTGHYLIKRVIGVPGDHIVADGRGSLTVNGAPLNETYLKNGTSPSEVAFDVVVPEGFIWVMGDNRSNSADSRYHQDDAHGGFVPIDDVAGVAKVVVWPINHWRGLGGGHEAFDDVPEPGRAPVPAAPAPEDGA